MADPTTLDGRATGGGAAQPVTIMNQQMPQTQALASGAATAAKQDTGNTSLTSIDGKVPAPGQALAAGSVPVVLPAAQVTTLTPPAAITGFATAANQSTSNTSLGSLAAMAGPFTAPASGELAGSVTQVQLPSIACKYVRFRGRATNAGNVYLGTSSGITIPDGTTDTTTGFSITPGADTGWIPVDNLNRFYRICDNAGDALTYLALN